MSGISKVPADFTHDEGPIFCLTPHLATQLMPELR